MSEQQPVEAARRVIFGNYKDADAVLVAEAYLALSGATGDVAQHDTELIARTLFASRAVGFAPPPHWDQDPNPLRGECWDDACDVVRALSSPAPNPAVERPEDIVECVAERLADLDYLIYRNCLDPLPDDMREQLGKAYWRERARVAIAEIERLRAVERPSENKP